MLRIVSSYDFRQPVFHPVISSNIFEHPSDEHKRRRTKHERTQLKPSQEIESYPLITVDNSCSIPGAIALRSSRCTHWDDGSLDCLLRLSVFRRRMRVWIEAQ